MLGPLDPSQIIERVKTATALRGCEGVAELSAITESDAIPGSPWAFVFIGAESADKSKGTSLSLVQHATVLVSVVIAVRNARGNRGSSATGDVVAVVNAVREKIMGWKHPQAREAFDFHSGRLIRQKAGVVWWQETYRTNYRIEVNA